jgi:hypothetical protein
VGAVLAFLAATGELRRGGDNGVWTKVEAVPLWMLVFAGQRDGAPAAIQFVSSRVLQFMVVMERCGRTVKMDDAHGNVSASMLLRICLVLWLWGQASLFECQRWISLPHCAAAELKLGCC